MSTLFKSFTTILQDYNLRRILNGCYIKCFWWHHVERVGGCKPSSFLAGLKGISGTDELLHLLQFRWRKTKDCLQSTCFVLRAATLHQCKSWKTIYPNCWPPDDGVKAINKNTKWRTREYLCFVYVYNSTKKRFRNTLPSHPLVSPCFRSTREN